jgi:hypothetical protein
VKEYLQITMLCVTGIFMLAILIWSPALTDALALTLAGYRLLGWWGKFIYLVSLVILWIPALLAIWIGFILAWKRFFYVAPTTDETTGRVDKELPAVAPSVAAIATTAVFCALFFPFVWVPIVDHVTHASDWPTGLRLVNFGAIVSNRTTGDGELTIGVRNESNAAARDVQFSVFTGFNLDERLTLIAIPVIAPGTTSKTVTKASLGDVRPRRRARGGMVDAHARIEWDWVRFDGSFVVNRTARPPNARVTVSSLEKPIR